MLGGCHVVRTSHSVQAMPCITVATNHLPDAGELPGSRASRETDVTAADPKLCNPLLLGGYGSMGY